MSSCNVIPPIIPPITDPLGSHWVQPAPDDILVSDDTAVMSQPAFAGLREYSSTIPSGVYPGKMWKAQLEDGWYLRWYGIVPGREDLCSNNQRKISIMDWKAMMGIAQKAI
jgi:hypothetical protein